jgi:autotransporter translocation and assembly factor TamB
VDTLAVRVDDKNDIQLTGSAELKAPFVFDVNGAISLPELKALNTLLKNFKAPPMDSGSLFAKVAGRGQLRPWQYTGDASLTATKVRTPQMPQAADAVLSASFEGKRANITQLEATLGPWKVGVKGVVDDKQANLAELKVWQNKTLLLNGRAKVPFDVLKTSAGEPMDVNITARDLRVNEILAAAGIKGIPAGVLDAEIHLQGRLETAAGTAHVSLKDVKAPKAPKAFQPATAVLDITLAGKQAKALLTVVQPPLQTLTLTAEVPLNIVQLAKNPGKFGDTPIKAHLDMPETDVGFLREYASDKIRNLPGKMRIQADVSGTVKAPVIEAAADLHISEIAWVKADLPSVRDVRVRIRANDRKIRVEDISAIMAGGRVKIAGDVDATNFKEPTVTLKVNAYEALIFRDPTTSLRANANLTCEGTLKAARVSGLVELVRGRIFKEIDLTPELSLPSDVPPLPPDTQRREASLPIPAMLSDWTFNVAVKTHDPILIAGNLANGALSIDASIFGTGAVPVISGGGTIDRLYLKLPYSIVKITKGVITLNPEKPMDPALDLRGESRVGNHDITLYVYGDSSAPKTRFTSIPPMPEADIVTLLATGTTLSGSSSEAAAEAASRALMVYVTDFYRKIFRKKKVVRTEPPRLHITFNPAAANSTNTNVSDSVQVTYDLNQFWRLRGGYAQTGRVRGFLAYVFRFGEAAVAVDEEADRPNLVRKLGGQEAPPVGTKAPQKGTGASSAAPAVRSR